LATIEETKVGIIPADKMGGPHKNHQTHSGSTGGRGGVMSIKVRCLSTIVVSKGVVHDFRQPINMHNVWACIVCTQNQIIKINSFLLKANVFGQHRAPGQKQICAKQVSSPFWVRRRAGNLS
jgi:hypothetical protein